MGRAVFKEPQCLYKCNLYLYFMVFGKKKWEGIIHVCNLLLGTVVIIHGVDFNFGMYRLQRVRLNDI